ncbi:flagellar hook capping protein [Paenibacillus nanensis]|uniref:Flagellar hook capping protein n=1 Tax=Paenibacillus nanensis TaxID=393251 RepID=A0A3A1UXB6_9BACL|nr:flagellar hook capping FlgD N-terminal domain-containing protein [Paenibacillus nanensis]RIX51822.1 flagellar hook capping protein [Paenibacillus nanensis]
MADSVSTRNVWPNYDKSNVQAAAAKKNTDALGKDQFLQILVTQLRNQDPMQPMQDKEFIAQMAQFTSVEQLMNMSTELSLLRQNIGTASSLIGKWVEWNEYDASGSITAVNGKVDSILSKDGVLYAKIGGKEVALDYLVSISENEPAAKDDESAEETEEGTEEVETP